MILFRRRRTGRHAEDGDIFARPPEVDSDDEGEEALEEYLGGLSGEEESKRDGGPYDAAAAPSDEVERIDLGSLKIPKLSGVDIRVQAGQQGEAFDVVLVAGESALQVGAFAAPRTDGIWNEVREELRDSITSQGGTAEEVAGRFGAELRARVRTPNGPADIRFVGVDGPRWFVRGLYQGRAATDPAAGATLDECFDGLLVSRDKEARPVREPLPLTLPEEIAAQIEQAAQEQAQTAPGQSDLAAPNGAARSRGGDGGRGGRGGRGSRTLGAG